MGLVSTAWPPSLLFEVLLHFSLPVPYKLVPLLYDIMSAAASIAEGKHVAKKLTQHRLCCSLFPTACLSPEEMLSQPT